MEKMSNEKSFLLEIVLASYFLLISSAFSFLLFVSLAPATVSISVFLSRLSGERHVSRAAVPTVTVPCVCVCTLWVILIWRGVGVARSVERRIRDREAAGSIPGGMARDFSSAVSVLTVIRCPLHPLGTVVAR